MFAADVNFFHVPMTSRAKMVVTLVVTVTI